MTDAGLPPAVAVCGVDFGWGSAGKLSAVVRACLKLYPGLRIVVLGTRLGRPVLANHPVEAWYEHWPTDRTELRELLDRHRVAASLVVLDPEAAGALEAARCPTVFVDSLPYLWTPADPLPFDVTAYCAQNCPSLPRPSWEPLRRIAHLHWVEGITSEILRRPRDPRQAVLNLGGLHSPVNPHGNPTYVRLMLTPALAALADTGYDMVDVCGNVDASDLPGEREELGITVRVGSRTHAEFLALVAQTGLLVTSPGLTTLLEASAHGTPTVCLPPQNLSQILNGDRFARITDSGCRVAWPSEVLDLEEVEQARMHGEEAGLAVMDRALASHDPVQVHPRLRRGIEVAIWQAQRFERWSALADDAGRDGAQQVARILLDIVAHGRPECEGGIVRGERRIAPA